MISTRLRQWWLPGVGALGVALTIGAGCAVEEEEYWQEPVTLGTTQQSLYTVGSGSIKILTTSANYGNRATETICARGDVSCTVTHADASEFNAMTAAQLASYDVILIQWASAWWGVDVNWSKISTYVTGGGGFIFDGDYSVGGLSPAVSGYTFEAGSSTVTATVPGLTDGITNSFVNNHVAFAAWDSSIFAPFLSQSGQTTGLYGKLGAGRLVLTGPDQDYHAWVGSNQYNLLINEILWVTTPNNQPPVALCQNLTLGADASCTACGSIDAGSYDPDAGDSITLAQAPGCSYGLGSTTVALTATDTSGAASSCTGTVSVVDNTPPRVACNAPATIVPPSAPISFTATAEDNCGVAASVIGYDCYMINPAGKRVDKTDSCVVSFAGDTITIVDSGGVGDHITWTISAMDSGGNTTTAGCEVIVANPGKGVK
jgi:hypothetical protein